MQMPTSDASYFVNFLSGVDVRLNFVFLRLYSRKEIYVMYVCRCRRGIGARIAV